MGTKKFASEDTAESDSLPKQREEEPKKKKRFTLKKLFRLNKYKRLKSAKTCDENSIAGDVIAGSSSSLQSSSSFEVEAKKLEIKTDITNDLKEVKDIQLETDVDTALLDCQLASEKDSPSEFDNQGACNDLASEQWAIPYDDLDSVVRSRDISMDQSCDLDTDQSCNLSITEDAVSSQTNKAVKSSKKSPHKRRYYKVGKHERLSWLLGSLENLADQEEGDGDIVLNLQNMSLAQEKKKKKKTKYKPHKRHHYSVKKDASLLEEDLENTADIEHTTEGHVDVKEVTVEDTERTSQKKPKKEKSTD